MPLQVTVPASSANLGPGFDALGLAIDLTCTVTARPASEDTAHYSGEGNLTLDGENLVHIGFREALKRTGMPTTPVALEIHNEIPLARGLGSSSAALVAGILLGDAVTGGRLGREGALQLAADLEGHPDNVAPALLGGVTLSAQHEGQWVTSTLPWPEDWNLLFGVPAFEVPTSEARAVLPTVVDRADAILTASRLAFWPIALLKRDPSLLRVASQDVMHEPHRQSLLPGFAETQQALLEAGVWAAYLSGAGPTMAVVCSSEQRAISSEHLARYAGPAGRVLKAQIGQAAAVMGAWDEA